MITSKFGDRDNPLSDDEEIHNGIDIGAKEGTAIVSAKDGLVIKVGYINTYGNYIKYKTNDNYTIMYAHCNEIFAIEGDWVERGQILATVGSTGMSTGPHLHYSISYDGEFLDPKLFLEDMSVQ